MSSVRESAVNDRSDDVFVPHRLILSGFVLDLTAGELLTADEQLAGLRKQALDVLLVLGARAGQVVSKDELMRVVWRDVVVGEGSLPQAISDIRHVLQDHEHRLVRNVARRGYMLVPDPAPDASGAAEPTACPSVSTNDISAADSNSAPTRRRGWRPKRSAAIAALVLTVATLAGTVAFIKNEQQRTLVPTTRPPLAGEVPAVSLVVLPLNGTAGAGDDWFADAITADLTNSAGRMSGSFVIGRDTAYTYKGKQVDPRDVARELGVRYVLLGTIRRDGERVRLNLSMVDGESGVQRWDQQFDIDRAELKRSIDDIVGQLARSLFVQLFHSVGERATRLNPNEIAADDLAMRGWSVYFRGLSPENFRESLRLFEEALTKDPNSVRALAGVSNTSSFGVNIGWLPDKAAALRRAEETTARLEQLGTDDWFTLNARIGLMNVRREWESMLRVADTMVERFPNDPTAHYRRGSALMYLGRFEESIPAAQRAIQLSPRDTRFGLWSWCVANSQFMLGQYDAATESARRSQAASPNFPWQRLCLRHRWCVVGTRRKRKNCCANTWPRSPTSTHLASLPMRSNHPRFVEGRDRMIASLREIGLP